MDNKDVEAISRIDKMFSPTKGFKFQAREIDDEEWEATLRLGYSDETILQDVPCEDLPEYERIIKAVSENSETSQPPVVLEGIFEGKFTSVNLD